MRQHRWGIVRDYWDSTPSHPCDAAGGLIWPSQRGIREVRRRWVHRGNRQRGLSPVSWKCDAKVRCPSVEAGVEDSQNWPIDADVFALCQEKVDDELANTKSASNLDGNGEHPLFGVYYERFHLQAIEVWKFAFTTQGGGLSTLCLSVWKMPGKNSD